MKLRYLTSDNCISGNQELSRLNKSCELHIENGLIVKLKCLFLLFYMAVEVLVGEHVLLGIQLSAYIEIVHRHTGSSINVWCAERYQFKNITVSCKSQ